MRQWKAAGPAPRDVDEKLWQRFRGAQDTFFGARDAAQAEQDQEFAANADVKEALLVEAEALVPVTDLEAAKRAIRDIAERWEAAGKVPRDRIKELEGRLRKVEQAIRGVEDDQWRRTDPEKSARADDMVSKLEAAIADIERDLDAARPRATTSRSRTSRTTSPRASRSSTWPSRSPPTTRLRAPREGGTASPCPGPPYRPRESCGVTRRQGGDAGPGRSAGTEGGEDDTGTPARSGRNHAGLDGGGRPHPDATGDPVGVEDARDRPDGAQHVVEVLGLGHLEA